MNIGILDDTINNALNDALFFILKNNIPTEKFDKNIQCIYRYYITNNICRYLMNNNIKIAFYNTNNIIFKYFNNDDLLKLLIKIFNKLNNLLPIIISNKAPNDNGVLIELNNNLKNKTIKISNLNKLRKYNIINNIPSLNNDLINSLKFRQFFTKTELF